VVTAQLRRGDLFRRRRGPDGPLRFLKFSAAHAFEIAAEITEGWVGYYRRRGEQSQGEPAYFVIEVFKPTPEVLTALDVSEHVAAQDMIFRIEDQRTRRPLGNGSLFLEGSLISQRWPVT